MLDNVKTWELSYLTESDELYFTDQILSSAIPKTIKDNITVYYYDDYKPAGILIEHASYSLQKYGPLRQMCNFIKQHYCTDILHVPLKEEFITPLIKIIQSANLQNMDTAN